ncbi:MAG: hypothetical protein ACRC4L_00185 [Mycoplasma sp.]
MEQYHELEGKVICFCCTSHFNSNNKHLFKINKNCINSKKDTYVDMTKIFFVKAYDIDWKSNWGLVTDEEVKSNVNNFIKTYFKAHIKKNFDWYQSVPKLNNMIQIFFVKLLCHSY